MRFGLLGTLLVHDGTTDRVVPAGKHRVLLAALLLRPGRVTPLDTLVEYLWDGHPPDRARATVQSYMTRLRRSLGKAAAARIVTRTPGYLIEVSDDEVDLTRFAAARERGMQASAAGDWAKASDEFRAALDQWRDEALLDVASQTLHRDETPRLCETRHQALEWRIDADLRLGRHAEIISELHTLVREHPLREHYSAQLMLALHRAGRQSEALALFQQTSRTLETGATPG
jgi:DNA-binding SARP family transcriptional activator